MELHSYGQTSRRNHGHHLSRDGGKLWHLRWRSNFPGPRHVNLNERSRISHRSSYIDSLRHNHEDNVEPSSTVYLGKKGKMKGYLPPVTLYVNQDSREEALKHSTVIPIRHSVSDDHLYEAIKPVRHPLWFRSGVDSVYFRNAYPLAGTFFSQISTSVENLKWLRYIQDLTPRLLASIDKMEHQDFYGLRNSNSWHAAEHLELFPSLKYCSLLTSLTALVMEQE